MYMQRFRNSALFVSGVGPLALLGLALAAGCTSDNGDESGNVADSGIDGGIDGGIDSGDGDGDGAGDSGSGDAGKLDAFVGDGDSDGPNCGMEGNQCGECELAVHTPCDATANPTFGQAMGLGCPNEAPIVPSFNGNPGAIGLRSAFGNAGAFPPREGSKFVAMGSGFVADLDQAGGLTACSQDLGAHDPGSSLPAPIRTNSVGAQTCDENAGLVGTGDCSNTIQDQFNAGGSAFDYTELRFSATVPDTASSFSYDLAFFSYEYPVYYGSQYNDMYIGWLESMNWTGNISFDEMGNPISLNAGFLDYKDATGGTANDPACATGCSAPEIQGTCMAGHAGTKWLTSQAPVTPGEQITVVFAVFDLSDSVLDSYVFLDNFQWGCEGDMPPSTVPVG